MSRTFPCLCDGKGWYLIPLKFSKVGRFKQRCKCLEKIKEIEYQKFIEKEKNDIKEA